MAAIAKHKPRIPHSTTPKLSKALGNRIFDRMGKGLPWTLACQAEGVAPNTADEWVRRGLGTDDRPPTDLTKWFAAGKERARAEWAQASVVKLAEFDDWHPTAWLLERVMPEHFSRPSERVEVTGQGGGPITIKLAFDPTPIAAASRRELGGPVIDLTDDVVEET